MGLRYQKFKGIIFGAAPTVARLLGFNPDNCINTDSTNVQGAIEDINGKPGFSGTHAEYEIAKQSGLIKEGMEVCFTDDEEDTELNASSVTYTTSSGEKTSVQNGIDALNSNLATNFKVHDIKMVRYANPTKISISSNSSAYATVTLPSDKRPSGYTLLFGMVSGVDGATDASQIYCGSHVVADYTVVTKIVNTASVAQSVSLRGAWIFVK